MERFVSQGSDLCIPEVSSLECYGVYNRQRWKWEVGLGVMNLLWHLQGVFDKSHLSNDSVFERAGVVTGRLQCSGCGAWAAG